MCKGGAARASRAEGGWPRGKLSLLSPSPLQAPGRGAQRWLPAGSRTAPTGSPTPPRDGRPVASPCSWPGALSRAGPARADGQTFRSFSISPSQCSAAPPCPPLRSPLPYRGSGGREGPRNECQRSRPSRAWAAPREPLAPSESQPSEVGQSVGEGRPRPPRRVCSHGTPGVSPAGPPLGKRTHRAGAPSVPALGRREGRLCPRARGPLAAQ